MKKTFNLVLLIAVFWSCNAMAQQSVSPCIQSASPFGGTNCAPVSDANPMPVDGSIVVAPDADSGAYVAKTVTSSSTQMLAAGVATKFLQINNESTTATIACNFGGTAALNTAGSITLPPGWTATWDGTFIPDDAINCISSAATSAATFGAK